LRPSIGIPDGHAPRRQKETTLSVKLTKEHIAKLEGYLRKTFGTKALTVRAKKADMAEVYVGEDFVATITVDDEDGDVAYQFQMAILDMDLDEV
jgi:hypothetical protein